jgi:hypothetical protein
LELEILKRIGQVMILSGRAGNGTGEIARAEIYVKMVSVHILLGPGGLLHDLAILAKASTMALVNSPGNCLRSGSSSRIASSGISTREAVRRAPSLLHGKLEQGSMFTKNHLYILFEAPSRIYLHASVAYLALQKDVKITFVSPIR